MFFDGECGLCDRTVRWLIASDPGALLRFCPLQSPHALELLPGIPRSSFTDPGTLILLEQGALSFKSDAVLRILTLLGGWKAGAAGSARFIPLFLRDRCYDWVARNRHRWFPAGQHCMNDPGIRGRFIG